MLVNTIRFGEAAMTLKRNCKYCGKEQEVDLGIELLAEEIREATALVDALGVVCHDCLKAKRFK